MQEAKEEPNLAEVKAVLMKLQRFDFAEEEPRGGAGGSVRGRALLAVPAAGAAIGVFDRKHAAISAAGRKKGSGRRIAYLAGAAALIPCAIFIFYAAGGMDAQVPISLSRFWPLQSANRLTRHEKEGTLLAQARQTLSEGAVERARTILLRGGPERHADMAFVLAQSYDPNYLQSLPRTNAAPDRAEAARWYKKWYELAQQNGLEMDSGRLQRIINAMH